MRIYAITEQLIRSRVHKGLTQKDLARLAGVSNGYISMVERAVKSVGPGVAAKLSEVLEKQIDELFQIK